MLKEVFILKSMFGILFGIFIGFLLFTLTTHPGSRINKKLPEKKIKNFQIFPRVNISARNRVFHFHHWIILTPFYLFLQNFLHSDILHGIILGGIVQGLMFKDRFKIIFKREDYHQIKESSIHIPLLQRFRKK